MYFFLHGFDAIVVKITPHVFLGCVFKIQFLEKQKEEASIKWLIDENKSLFFQGLEIKSEISNPSK